MENIQTIKTLFIVGILLVAVGMVSPLLLNMLSTTISTIVKWTCFIIGTLTFAYAIILLTTAGKGFNFKKEKIPEKNFEERMQEANTKLQEEQIKTHIEIEKGKQEIIKNKIDYQKAKIEQEKAKAKIINKNTQTDLLGGMGDFIRTDRKNDPISNLGSFGSMKRDSSGLDEIYGFAKHEPPRYTHPKKKIRHVPKPVEKDEFFKWG